MPWHLLLKLNLTHVKIVVAAALFFLVAGGAALGALLAGWKGAVLLPLLLLLGAAVSLHFLLKGLFAYGMSTYRRGNHSLAMRFLWLAKLPRLRRYDPSGSAAQAFGECTQAMAGQMMQDVARSFLAGR